MNKTVQFWLFAITTIVVETTVSYAIYQMLLNRGYMMTFRVDIPTVYLSFNYILLFSAAVFSALTIGIFKGKDNGDVQSLFQYIFSFIKHPIPVGSVLLLLFTFFFM